MVKWLDAYVDRLESRLDNRKQYRWLSFMSFPRYGTSEFAHVSLSDLLKRSLIFGIGFTLIFSLVTFSPLFIYIVYKVNMASHALPPRVIFRVCKAVYLHEDTGPSSLIGAVILTAFHFLLFYPFMLAWNRRADKVATAVVRNEIPANSPDVWPPPPTISLPE